MHPADFDATLQYASSRIEEAKYRDNPELKRISDEEIRAKVDDGLTDYEDFMHLGTPNGVLARAMLESDPEASEGDIQGLIAYFDHRRDEHRYFIAEPEGSGRPLDNQYIRWTSGANYEVAKLVAGFTDSHLVTDLRARWYELSIDTDADTLKDDPWQPFARAFSDVPLRFLNDVPLRDALSIRQDGSLESMRTFLRRLWQATISEDSSDESTIFSLTDALRAEVSTAETE